jgi:hypothetical protein
MGKQLRLGSLDGFIRESWWGLVTRCNDRPRECYYLSLSVQGGKGIHIRSLSPLLAPLRGGGSYLEDGTARLPMIAIAPPSPTPASTHPESTALPTEQITRAVTLLSSEISLAT